jgi:hypothetical protein
MFSNYAERLECARLTAAFERAGINLCPNGYRSSESCVAAPLCHSSPRHAGARVGGVWCMAVLWWIRAHVYGARLCRRPAAARSSVGRG